MSESHSCCFCHEIVQPEQPSVFIHGRGLHAHAACQLPRAVERGERVGEPARFPTRLSRARAAGK
jgi:hypothetical protein